MQHLQGRQMSLMVVQSTLPMSQTPPSQTLVQQTPAA